MEAAKVRDGTGGLRAAPLLAWSLAALSVVLNAPQLTLFMQSRDGVGEER